MPNKTESDLLIKANPGQINIDEAQGIVECFVAGIGNKDSVGDIVQPGAFTESLKRRRPRVVWGHNWNDPIGKVLEIYEVGPNDPRLPEKMKKAGIGGLYAKVQFNLNTEKGREAFASVAFFGQDQEWSIGYKTINATFDPARQANILREVELYECSPVLHGANQLTGTISVKNDPFGSADLEAEEWGDFEFDDFDEKGDSIRDPKGGLTAAGRRHFARTEGANLKPGVKGPADTPEKMRRKGSFLTRFFSNPSGPMKKPNGKPTRLALSAAAWGEPVPQDRSDAAKLAAKGRRMLERYQNAKKKDADFDEVDVEAFWDEFTEWDFDIDEKCGMMGHGMPGAVRHRWMEMVRESRQDDDDDEREDIFEEGLAQDLSPERQNELEMEMNSRSKYPVKILEATENSVTFQAMKDGQKLLYRMGYHYDTDQKRYMFGKPERMQMTFAPMRPVMPMKPVMARKPNIDPNQQYSGGSDDESLMPRVLRIVQKFGDDEKSLLDDQTVEFLDEMTFEMKAGRVISSRNMAKLKNVVSLLQEILATAGEVEQKSGEMFISCDIKDAFATKSLLDPIIEYHGAVAEVTEHGIHIKSGATSEFKEAVNTATHAFSVKALGGQIGGGGGKGRRAARFATARFDPNAIDGDEDGLVQEGTPFERPATPKPGKLADAVRSAAKPTVRTGAQPSQASAADKARAMDRSSAKKYIDSVLKDLEKIQGDQDRDWIRPLRSMSSDRPLTIMDALSANDKDVAARAAFVLDSPLLEGARIEKVDNADLLRSLDSPNVMDRAYWRVDGDGNPVKRTNSDGFVVPSWLEDQKMNSMLNNEFNQGKPVSMLARENGLSRYEVRRAIQADVGDRRGVKKAKSDGKGGFASDLNFGDRQMVQRDANGKVVYDGSKLLNELAEKREKLLRDLGFGDEQIAELLGYTPQPKGFASGARKDGQMYRALPESNIADLVDLIKKRNSFLDDNKDFDPDLGSWDDEDWLDKWEKYTDITDEIQSILDFYDQEGDALADRLQKADDIRSDIDELRDQIKDDAELFLSDHPTAGDDWRQVVGAVEMGDKQAFMTMFASRRQEGDIAVGDGVEVLGDDSKFLRQNASSTFDSISDAINGIDEKQTELYGAELDISEAQKHGHAAKAVAELWKRDGKIPGKGKQQVPERGFASRAVNEGVGLGKSREIKGRGKSGISRAFFNAADETLTVSWGGDDYTYYGVSPSLVEQLEASPSQGRVMQTIKNSATGFIRVNPNDGTFRMEGKAPTPAQHLSKDMDRISKGLKLSDAEMQAFRQAVDLRGDSTLLGRMGDKERMDIARDIADLAANMSSRKEFAAAERLHLAALAISPNRTSANKIEPVTDKLELTLSADEVMSFQRSLSGSKSMIQQRLGSDNARLKAVNASIDGLFDKIKKSDSGVVKMTSDEYREIYDALDEGTGFTNLKGVQFALDQVALSKDGKYSTASASRALLGGAMSGRQKKMSGIAAPNNGAPLDITPRMQDEFIFWGRRQPGFRRVQDIVKKYDENDGSLRSKEWIRLHDYYALHSKAGKGMPLYGQSKRSGFGSMASGGDAPDAPRKRAPGAGRKMGDQLEKRFRGKKWEDVKPADWDLMSPSQQEDELFTNLKPERSGLRQVDFDKLVREVAERGIADDESPAERRRRQREERMAERAREIEGLSEDQLEERRRLREAREAKPTQTPEDGKEMTPKEAKAVRKKVKDGLDRSIFREGDRMREAADSGDADPMHSEAWDNMAEIMSNSNDLTLSQLDALEEALNEYIDDANSIDELTGSESRSVRSAKALLSKIEDLKEQYSDDKYILQGETETGEKIGRGSDEILDAVERQGFASSVNTGTIRNYLNVRNDAKVRERGFASRQREGRTEVKGQATFFKDIKDSLPKEIREADKAGDKATSKALTLLDKIMDRQDTAKTGSKRTDAGQLLVTQAELDQILDALMVVIDRQMEIGGSDDRIQAFVKLIDMLASSGMATFINQTQEEIGSRTQDRTNSRGQTVQIPNT